MSLSLFSFLNAFMFSGPRLQAEAMPGQKCRCTFSVVEEQSHTGMVIFSVLDPYSLNPDPAKKLNSDPDPSYFLTLSEKKLN